MPTGSPSPPYKANPKQGFQDLDLLTKSISIGGIKREAYFYALCYKKNKLLSTICPSSPNKKYLSPRRKKLKFSKNIFFKLIKSENLKIFLFDTRSIFLFFLGNQHTVKKDYKIMLF